MRMERASHHESTIDGERARKAVSTMINERAK